jgi:hypothetical protein
MNIQYVEIIDHALLVVKLKLNGLYDCSYDFNHENKNLLFCNTTFYETLTIA